LHSELAPGGYIFFQYPHALSKKDTRFPDLSYVSYSPRRIEKAFEERFEVIEHCHFFDGRIVDEFDTKHYDAEQGKSFRNGYVIKAKRID
jgi:hypothetical protein